MMMQDEKTYIGKIDDVLDHIQRLPSLSSMAIEILENFDNEMVDIPTMANKIARDPAIVARVLRVANSPFFGLSGQIGSIAEAVSVLGFNNLRGLVTAAAVINAFPGTEKGLDLKEFWSHGIATAACAKVLARRAGLNPETAFTAGLVHDIGKLVMGVYFPQAFEQAHRFNDDSSMEALQAERSALGLDHAALGGEVAKRWNFPPAIRDAVALHHTQVRTQAGTQAGTATEKTLADVVYIANLFAHALDDGHIREDRMLSLATEANVRLAIGNGALETLAEEAQRLYNGAVLLIGG